MFSNAELKRITEIVTEIQDIRFQMDNDYILPSRWESLDIDQADLHDELKKIFDDQ